MSDPCNIPKTEEILQQLGGTKGAMEFFGVTKGAISQWRANGIPDDKIKFLIVARPEIFGMAGQSRARLVAAARSTPP